MSATVRLEPMFARHETFAPRAGWFKKIYDAISINPDVFRAEDATLALGVGKNMVRSMRFWGGAADLVNPRRPARIDSLLPTHFAHTVFAEDGWDPFLEHPSTLWLLHWRMMSSGCQLPVWHFAFNDLQQSEFTVESLSGDAAKAVATHYGFEKQVAAGSVRRDVECLVHTYARRPADRILLDDSLACPFRALGLVESGLGKAGSYRFAMARKPSLHDDITLFAALDFVATHAAGSHSVSISRLSRSPMSPGRLFKLDEDSLLEALARASQKLQGVTVVDTAGVSALQFEGNAEQLAIRVLNSHFKATGKRLLRLRDEGDLLSNAAGEGLNA